MISLLGNPPPPDVSIEASASDQSKYDQELGSNTRSRNEDVLMKKKTLCNLRNALDLGLIREILAEAVGTFILVFCICGIFTSMDLMKVQVGLMEYATTATLTVIVVVISTGSISGAHVNPAITIAFAAVGPFPWSKVPLYVLAQVGGSVLATYSGRLIYGTKPDLLMTKPLHGCTEAFLAEFMATLIILFLIASLANDPQSIPQLSAFVAGAAIGLGVLITGPVSGGSMNPARSLGPAIVSWDFDCLWIYLVAPTLGAICGGILFRLLRLQGWSCKDISSSRTNHSSTS